MTATESDFTYDGVLFAEVGNGKRFPRASKPDVKALLLPRKSLSHVKDETANFYLAQLMHYGLPRTKDKNSAKVRLTAALSAGQLDVPNDVKSIETRLKREYVNAAETSSSATTKKSDSVLSKGIAGHKRKADAMENTKISVTIGDISIAIDRTSVSTSTTKQNTSERGIVASELDTKVKKTPRKPKKSLTAAAKERNREKRKKRRLPPRNRTIASTANTSISDIPDRPATEGGTERLNYILIESSEDEAEPEPAPAHLPVNEHGGPPTRSSLPKSLEGPSISGTYHIDASMRESRAELRLRLSVERNQLWGKFFVGQKQGILRLDGIDGISSGVRKAFGWRCKDAKISSELRLGKGCEGWICFNGSGAVSGAFHNLVTG